MLLWTYAGLVLFTWYIASMTPDWAVLLRVAASILNDIIWIPLGIIVWSGTFLLFAGKTKKKTRKTFVSLCIFFGVAFLVILLPDMAFKFLFIPLSLAILAFIHALIKRRHELQILGRYVPVALIILMTVFHYRYQMIPHKIVARSGQDIKVMSYNIFCDAGKTDREKEMETIRNEGADVVCCMEFNTFTDKEIFSRELGGIYPYTLISGDPRDSKSGAIILSKFPITAEELPSKKGGIGSRFEMILAELDIKGKKIHIVNYHLKTVGHYILYVADKRLDLKMKLNFAARNEVIFDREKYTQAKYIENLITTSSEPAILCGDLNDTPNSRAFQVLERKYTNSFSARGWGLGATFGEVKTKAKLRNRWFASFFAHDVLRIDHIFVTKGTKVISAQVLNNAKGSDHRPIVAVVEIR
jgi:endonuclease/exonuclease/phosphatase family metal-dependent hydrolase